MLVAPFRVVLDANVLFPFTLRDTLLRAAEAGTYQIYWSATIIDETRRNLVKKISMTEVQAEHLVSKMNEAFPEALVTDFEDLIPAMRCDAKDRHVVAAAVKAHAQVIVTFNLDDFYDLPEGIEAQAPDAFLLHIFDLDKTAMVRRLEEQAAGMKKNKVTLNRLLEALAKMVPEFARAINDDRNTAAN